MVFRFLLLHLVRVPLEWRRERNGAGTERKGERNSAAEQSNESEAVFISLRVSLSLARSLLAAKFSSSDKKTKAANAGVLLQHVRSEGAASTEGARQSEEKPISTHERKVITERESQSAEREL